MVESREHGQVRLAGPEMLDALALSDPATASAFVDGWSSFFTSSSQRR